MYVVRHPIDEIWAPVSYGSGGALTLYMGQLVTTKSGSSTIISSGAVNMIAAAGASDTTGKIVPFGVVCGTNNFDPKIFDTATTGVETITSANTPALQVVRNFRGVEGAYPKNDPRAFVRISLIGPSTILWAPLFSATWGTAPTVYTITGGITQGSAFTTAATAAATAYNVTFFCRSGLNQNLSRIDYSASTTAHTFYVHWPYTLAVGDTFVQVPLKEFGTCYMNTDALGMFVDTTATYGTNYYTIEVLKLDLRVAGQEGVYFKFNADSFCSSR